MLPMSVGLLNTPQLLTFLWWHPNKPNARCWRSWNNQTCRCIHRRFKPLLQWKPNENVSEAAGHQDSPVETLLVQIIMCHHVQKPTLKAILCIPYCSAEQCCSRWLHPAATHSSSSASATLRWLHLSTVSKPSVSPSQEESLSLCLCLLLIMTVAGLLSSTPPFTSVCKPLTCLKAWSHMGVNAVPQPAVPSTPPPPPFSSLTGLQRSKHPAGFTSLPLILHCR